MGSVPRKVIRGAASGAKRTRSDYIRTTLRVCTTLRGTTKPQVLPAQVLPECTAPLAPGLGRRDYTIRRVVQSVPGLGAYVA